MLRLLGIGLSILRVDCAGSADSHSCCFYYLFSVHLYVINKIFQLSSHAQPYYIFEKKLKELVPTKLRLVRFFNYHVNISTR